MYHKTLLQVTGPELTVCFASAVSIDSSPEMRSFWNAARKSSVCCAAYGDTSSTALQWCHTKRSHTQLHAVLARKPCIWRLRDMCDRETTTTISFGKKTIPRSLRTGHKMAELRSCDSRGQSIQYLFNDAIDSKKAARVKAGKP